MSAPQRKFVRRLRSELLETRYCLANVAFRPHEIAAPDDRVSSVVAAVDLDGDRDLDLVTASTVEDAIVWYENVNGQGRFGSARVITTTADGARAIYAADIDGDGDHDLLSASYHDDQLAWYENLDARGTFGEAQLISALGDGAAAVHAGDVDGDGDVDVVAASFADDTVAWYENTDGHGTFGPQQVITTRANKVLSLQLGDVDGDGDLDVVYAAYNDNALVWQENVDGRGAFAKRHVITEVAYGAMAVGLGDVDGDGDIDVTSASYLDGKIAWYENLDAKGTFGHQQVVYTDPGRTRSVAGADLDGDGDYDLLSASRLEVRFPAREGMFAWYENLDGQGTFGPASPLTIEPEDAWFITVADLDGDNDLDVIGTTYHNQKLVWSPNLDGRGTFGDQRPLNSPTKGARDVSAADVDGDGDFDVLAASYVNDQFAWFENISGAGPSKMHLITETANGALAIRAEDMDGDGDMDVIGASYFDDTITWYENVDGKGDFSRPHVITRSALGAWTIHVVDIDRDNDFDVVAAALLDDTLWWFENRDGRGGFGAGRVISRQVDGPSGVIAGDLDGDGDIDVLSSSFYDNTIAWYANLNGTGTFSSRRVINAAAKSAYGVSASDMDGDGDLDVVSASYGDGELDWYENLNGTGTFGTPRRVGIIPGPVMVTVSDVDGDGDQDVLTAAYYGDSIAWFENIDRLGTFGSAKTVARAFGPRSVRAVDLDNDSDMDVLSASSGDSRVAWYENLTNSPRRITGDVDGNGVFDSSDLVIALQSGLFEYGTASRITFEQGDWNGDGRFDTSDLVLAFQEGNYQIGALDADVFHAALDML